MELSAMPLAAVTSGSGMAVSATLPLAATAVPIADITTAHATNNAEVYDTTKPLPGSIAFEQEVTSTNKAASLQRNFNRLTLSWENVNAVMPAQTSRCFGLRKLPPNKQRPEKRVLHNVTGAVRPGQLTAIMGASGAGKTTLLNFLNGRNMTATLKFSGEVRINGRPVQPWKVMPIVSAFVQQADLFIGTLTVLEHLRFQAHMRMGIDFTDAQREERIKQVMSSLGLNKCRNTIIGIPGRIKGISGGEMKRLSFASEVLTDPSIMFCDEPTSGLDSFMAKNVVSTLRMLAHEQGKTIICVIHQPSTETFELFDDVILLSEGRVAYHGSIAAALDQFAALGYVCPELYNPADFFIYTMAIQPGAEQQRCLERSRIICDAYQASDANKQMLVFIQKITEYSDKNKQSVSSQPVVGSSPKNVPAPNNAAQKIVVVTASDVRQQTDLANFDSIAAGNRYKASWTKQLRWVVWRSALTLKREPKLLKVRVIQTISIGLLLGLLFLRQERDTVKITDVQNLTGVTLLLLMNMSFSNMFAVINAFTGEMPVFVREYANAIYRVDTYYLSKILVDFPLMIVLPFVMTNIVYWMAGLNERAESWIIICCIYILVANCAVGFGYCLSCAAGNIDIALSVSGPLLICLLLFAGFFLNVDSIPKYFYPFKYISWFKYGNEALMVTRWDTIDTIVCTKPNKTVTLPNNMKISVISCPYTSGADVLHQLHYYKDQFNDDIIALCALVVGFRVLGFLILLLKCYLSSNRFKKN